MSTASPSPEPKVVAVTGAAGAIGYAMLMRIASGQMFGPDQPVSLRLIEVPAGMDRLRGVGMEVQDGAFPLVVGMQQTSDAEAGFGDADVAVLVGAQPRGPGMERADLMSANAKIFAAQGAALNAAAKRSVNVLVVGNPANTNALVASHNAPDIDPSQFAAMTRLDQNRAAALLAKKTGVPVRDVARVVIWGNHSATQFPDIAHATVAGRPAAGEVDAGWVRDEFIPRVQQRGAEIIGARGASSAASAASAAIDHVRDVAQGAGGDWQSMGVVSDGSYGVDEGIWYSVPCICPGGGKFERVKNVPEPDEFAAAMMDRTRKELLEERDAVMHLLPKAGTVKKTRGRKKKATKASA